MEAKRIFITGRGQVGNFYKDYFSIHGIEVENSDSETDIRDEGPLKARIAAFRPDAVIHTAAKTNIDWCEQNKLEAFSINTLGSDVVGKICEEENIFMVHLSSGCVLEGADPNKPQTEEVTPSPLCFYSWTKVWAEEMLGHRVRRSGLRLLVLRPRQLLSSRADPRNALTKMLTYNKFIDVPNSCTVVEDLMWVTEELIRREIIGTYNVTNPGVTTPFEIAGLLKEIVRPGMEFVKISKEELNHMTLAERVDSVLDTSKLNALGVRLPEIHARMREVMGELKKNLETAVGAAALAQTREETAKKLGLIKS